MLQERKDKKNFYIQENLSELIIVYKKWTHLMSDMVGGVQYNCNKQYRNNFAHLYFLMIFLSV
jgi:hypothetical protein